LSVCYAIYLGIDLQIFIGNLDPNVTEEELRQICMQLGDLIYVKIPVGKGCGFVQYVSR
jgi:RNA recognition motif-containing protein